MECGFLEELLYKDLLRERQTWLRWIWKQLESVLCISAFSSLEKWKGRLIISPEALRLWEVKNKVRGPLSLWGANTPDLNSQPLWERPVGPASKPGISLMNATNREMEKCLQLEILNLALLILLSFKFILLSPDMILCSSKLPFLTMYSLNLLDPLPPPWPLWSGTLFHIKYHYSPVPSPLSLPRAAQVTPEYKQSSLSLPPETNCATSLFACDCTYLFSSITILFSMYFNYSQESSLYPDKAKTECSVHNKCSTNVRLMGWRLSLRWSQTRRPASRLCGQSVRAVKWCPGLWYKYQTTVTHPPTGS